MATEKLLSHCTDVEEEKTVGSYAGLFCFFFFINCIVMTFENLLYFCVSLFVKVFPVWNSFCIYIHIFAHCFLLFFFVVIISVRFFSHVYSLPKQSANIIVEAVKKKHIASFYLLDCIVLHI